MIVQPPTACAAAHRILDRGQVPLRVYGLREDGVTCQCPRGASCGKNTAKHPAMGKGWQDQPVPTHEQIDEWYVGPFRSTFNVGVRTGPASNLVVIDLDNLESWPALCADLGIEEPDTYTVRTGSGGEHKYFHFPAGVHIGNSTSRLGPGLDVKAEDGQVVAPPSVTPAGRYEVINDAAVAEMPPALLARLLELQRRPQAVEGTRLYVRDTDVQYHLAAWESTLRELDECRRTARPDWRPGDPGPAWDDACFRGSRVGIEVSNTVGPEHLSREQARADYLSRAPRDDNFDPEDKWRRAEDEVGDKVRQPPPDLLTDWMTTPGAIIDPLLLADQPPQPSPDEGLWDELPILAHIRDYSHARLCSPHAVLAVVLARVVANVPPHVMLPAIVGGRASLNAFYALVGASGTGKGAAEAAAADAVDVGPVEVSSVGSGEGIAHLYAHREKREVVRDRESVLFSVPEVDTLTALGDRRGATLLSQLRSAWTGEQLGFGYADPTKALRIPAHSYRLSLVLGVQPGRAGALLDDADGGTPQRFCWAPTTDPRIPERATAPAPMRLDPQLWPPPSDGPCELVIPDIAEKAIRSARLATMRGQGDPLDGHALLCQLKLAAALTLLDGRRVVTADDWRRADVLMAVSRRTREGVQQYLARQASTANVARGKAEGQRLAVASEAHDDLATRRVARRLTDHLRQHGEASRSEARRRLPGRDRPFFDEAVARLVEAGQLTVCQTEHGERLRAIA